MPPGAHTVSTLNSLLIGGSIVVNSNSTFLNLLRFIAPDGWVSAGLVLSPKL